jgi:hypothetical protein
MCGGEGRQVFRYAEDFTILKIVYLLETVCIKKSDIFDTNVLLVSVNCSEYFKCNSEDI